MIRLYAGLINYNKRFYSLLTMECFVQQNSLLFTNHKFWFSHHSTPLTVKNDNSIEEITMTPQVESVIKSISKFGFNKSEIKTLMMNQPDLQKTSSDLWTNVVGSLLHYGLPKENVLSILEKWPKVLYLNRNDLEKNLVAWLNVGFGESIVADLLTTHPHFLKSNHTHVSKRVKQYQLHFESKNRIAKMLLISPNTLEESWDVLRDKLNYLDELCTEKSDVVASGVLSYSLLHIKTRHEFLIRAGIYKRPQKDFHKRLSKNPPLEIIVNTSDEEFVFKVAGLSIFEYNVFMDMFEEECEDIESGSDSDEESHKYAYMHQYCKNKPR